MDKTAAEATFAVENRIMEILAAVKAIQHVLYENKLTDEQSLKKIQDAAREKLNEGPEWKKVLSLLAQP